MRWVCCYPLFLTGSYNIGQTKKLSVKYYIHGMCMFVYLLILKHHGRCLVKRGEYVMLHYGSTNPMLNECVLYWFHWFRMKQTQMYVCTLGEFILVDVVTLLYMDEVRYGLESSLVYIQSQQ